MFRIGFKTLLEVANKEGINVNGHILISVAYMRYQRMKGHTLPAHLRPERLERHCHIIGQSGSGKSELMKHLFYELQKASEKKRDHAMILLEPHGDLAKEIKEFDLNNGTDRVVYLDPYLQDGFSPCLNPLQTDDLSEQGIDIHTQEVVSAFEKVMPTTQITVQMKALLEPCIATLLRTKKADLRDLQKFMNDKENSDLIELGKRSPNPSHRSFFENGFSNPAYKITKNSLYIKVQSMLNSHTLYNLFTGKTTIDLEQCIDDGKIIICNLSKGKMGAEASETFGVFFIAMIQSIIMKRANKDKRDRKPVFMFIDEFQNYVSPTIDTILSESRKYGLHLILAHQYLEQLDRRMRDNVFTNTKVKIMGLSNDKTFKALSKEMDIPKHYQKEMKKHYFFIYTSEDDLLTYSAPDTLIKDRKHYLNREQITAQDAKMVSNYYKAIKTPRIENLGRQQADDNDDDRYKPDSKHIF